MSSGAGCQRAPTSNNTWHHHEEAGQPLYQTDLYYFLASSLGAGLNS